MEPWDSMGQALCATAACCGDSGSLKLVIGPAYYLILLCSGIRHSVTPSPERGGEYVAQPCQGSIARALWASRKFYSRPGRHPSKKTSRLPSNDSTARPPTYFFSTSTRSQPHWQFTLNPVTLSLELLRERQLPSLPILTNRLQHKLFSSRSNPQL